MVQATLTQYTVGDCSFTSSGHHGTPIQREAVLDWGWDLADSAETRGFIHSGYTLLDEFDAALTDLVAPDATG